MSRLPKPIGVFACDDDRGHDVLEACKLAGLKVPEDVAVVGVDNDEVFCELADPPLSSIAFNAETAGYRAAALLDAMMQGRARKRQQIVVESLGVVRRRSTDIVAVDDVDIANALQFIRRQHGRAIAVDQVADEVGMWRRSLEKRFREMIGRSILEEVQLTRLQRAKCLLRETTFPISKVAEMAGFGSAGYFIQFFQKQLASSPRKYHVGLTYYRKGRIFLRICVYRYILITSKMRIGKNGWFLRKARRNLGQYFSRRSGSGDWWYLSPGYRSGTATAVQLS
jgi:LacI family transcriptional regulator